MFSDQFGNIPWTDADRVHKLITQDNESFKRWLTDTVFGITYESVDS